MALALQGCLILGPGEDVFIQLEVSPEKVVEEGVDPLVVCKDFLTQEAHIHVDADGPDQAVFGPKDRNRGAFETPGSDVQFVVQLVLVVVATRLEVENQFGGPVSQRSSGHLPMFDGDDGLRRVDEVMDEYRDPGIGERLSDQMNDPLVVLEVGRIVVDHRGAVVGLEQLLVGPHIVAREGVANQILFADNDQLAGCNRIPGREKVSHRGHKALGTELDVSTVIDDERIELVLLEALTLGSRLRIAGLLPHLVILPATCPRKPPSD